MKQAKCHGWLPCFVLFIFFALIGCSGDQATTGGTQSGVSGGAGGNLALVVDATGLARAQSGGPRLQLGFDSMVIRILDSTGTAAVHQDTRISREQAQQRVIISNIIPGNHLVEAEAFDANQVSLGSVRQPALVAPGQTTSVRLDFINPTPSPSPTITPTPTPTPAPTVAVPSQLAFSLQPANATVGQTVTVQVQVQAADASLVSTATDVVTIALANNPGGSTLGGTLTVNAVNGVATFNDLTLDLAGSGYTLVATSGTLTQATSQAFDITATPLAAGSLTLLQTVNTGAFPNVSDTNGNILLVPGFNDQNLSSYIIGADGLLTAAPGSPLGTGGQAAGVAIHPGAAFAYVTIASNPGDVKVISLAPSGALGDLGNFPSGGANPIGVAVNAGSLFTVNFNGQNVSSFTVDTGGTGPPLTPVATLPTRGNPVEVAIHPSNNFLYTSDGSGFALAGAAMTPLPAAPAEATGNSLAFSPDGSLLYFTNPATNTFSGFQVDAASGALTPIAGSPFAADGAAGQGVNSVTFSPDGRFLFLAQDTQMSIKVFSLGAGGVPTEIAGSPFANGSRVRNLRVHPNGQFLYAMNTFMTPDTVKVYAITQ